MTISQKLAEFVSTLKYENLPDDVKLQTKLCVLDTVGAVIAGAKNELAQLISTLKTGEVSGGVNASLLHSGEKSGLLNAVMINASIAHCAEIDDINPKSIICTGGMVVPSALSVGEYVQCSGRELLEAVAAGYEVASRVGNPVRGTQLLPKGFWPSAQFGPIGTAAAASRLLKLDGEKTAHALSSASTLCGGLINGGAEGPSCRHLLYGWSASSGVQSALAAYEGFTGPSAGFEEERGLYASRGCTVDEGKVLGGIGTDYLMKGVLPKRFASAMQIQAGIAAFLELVSEHSLSIEDIEKVTVYLPAKALIVVKSSGAVDNHTQAAADGRYLIAAAAVDGQVLPAQFEHAKIHNKDIRSFMDKVSVKEDKDLEKYGDNWPARVEINAKGKTLVKELANWCSDDISEREKICIDKFMAATRDAMSREKAKEIADMVLSLDKQGSARELIDLIIKR